MTGIVDFLAGALQWRDAHVDHLENAGHGIS